VSALAEIRAATRFLRHGLGKNYWNSFKIALARIDVDPEVRQHFPAMLRRHHFR
jgi:hypothetical protein